ncbi:MAG TPA: bifunctional phosphopantothenoylcysteine decarboxylase/phosphopantothenate--cysteine ligase CoaBC [Bacteroidetes bacterium]|nr:bifunctional phosphopantothenoylcysteine decarboxylase/phosphopantothenate--cysteine ligase CoaBC [Bacteroidota bacterium]
MLKGKKILIGITGGIAAYKIPFLVRLLKKSGTEVQVMLTPAARDFVTPLTLSTLSQRPVLIDFFNKDDGSWNSHIELGLWADLLLVAPLTANTLAKMASGIADNLLLTTILSSRCPVLFAPAMDLDMYQHPATIENIKKLKSFGYRMIEPVKGELASGLTGVGRLEEPEKILEVIKDALNPKSVFRGKKVLVSAGPTYEPVDPVRFLGNHSTGRMGIEMATAFAGLGAEVNLVLGPSGLTTDDPSIKVYPVTTAEEMYDRCMGIFPESDITVMAAAVADFTPANPSELKIKKETGKANIDLVPTKDILASMGSEKKPGRILVGFALETDNERSNAKKKLQNKNLDLIVLNSMKDKGAGFGYQTNKVTLISANGTEKEFPLKSKKEVARDILLAIEALL